MTDRDEPIAKVPGPRHAAPRVTVRSRLRGRALAIAAVPTALLMGAAYAPTLAMAATPTGTCATSPDTVLSETPVPKSELNVVPTPGVPTKAGTGSTGTTGTAGTTVKKTAAQLPAQQPAAVSAVYTTPVAGAAPQQAQQAQPQVQQADLIGDLLNGILHPFGGSSPTPTPTPSPTPESGKAPSQAPAPAPRVGAPVTPNVPTPGGAPSSAPSAAPTTAPTTAPSAAPAVPGGSASVAPAAPAASPSANPNCPVSTRALTVKAASDGDVVPEQNWVLHSTRLALHGSVFNGVYDVRTPTGTKRVLKFTTDSVDIGDLDMSTIEVQGQTFHVKGAPGSTSTMRQGPITMYVESLSGDLAGLLGLPLPIPIGPITLTPDTLPQWLYDLIGALPIPLDITLTNAKAVQAGQFRGTLHIPGMRMYSDHTPYDG